MATSYTATELQEETGVDRRTIAYYVHEGLLPKVGRRGPRTRYPKVSRDRLLFIRRVREAEEAGNVEAVSLRRIRHLFRRLSRAQVAAVAEGHIPVTSGLIGESSVSRQNPAAPARSAAPPAEPLRGDRSSDLERSADRPDIHCFLSARPFGGHQQQGEDPVLGALRDIVDLAHSRHPVGRPISHVWTRIEISPHVVLSVRGVTDDDRAAVDRVREALRGLRSRPRQ